MSAMFRQDSAFPHDAVVQRYLHTGPRRSRGKIVAAFAAGIVACLVIAATLPAGSSKSADEKRASVEPDKSAQASPPVEKVADAAPTSSKNDVDARAGTTGAAVNQPNTKPAPSIVETVIPTAPPAAPVISTTAPTPVTHADAAPMPLAPAPAMQSDAPPAPAPIKTAASNEAADSSDAAADVAPKPAPTKLARKASHRVTRAARIVRTAHARAPGDGARPTLVRVYALPDGRRVYQRVTGDEAQVGGGEIRRVYLAPLNHGYD